MSDKRETSTPLSPPVLSETPIVDGEQVNALAKKALPTAVEFVEGVARGLSETRDLIKENLAALRKIEESIQVVLRDQADLPQDIQLSALVGISAGTVIKVDRVNLDCVLSGQAKGQFIRNEAGEVVLIIHKRTRVVEKKE